MKKIIYFGLSLLLSAAAVSCSMDFEPTGAYSDKTFWYSAKNAESGLTGCYLPLRNGSMFAGLHDFEDGDFFDEHDSVVIYTPTRRLTYRIFAAYKRDDAHLMKRFDYSTEQGRQAFLDDIFSHTGHFRSDVAVTTDSRILTLSTCVGGEDDKRYVVQAVLTENAPVE